MSRKLAISGREEGILQAPEKQASEEASARRSKQPPARGIQSSPASGLSSRDAVLHALCNGMHPLAQQAQRSVQHRPIPGFTLPEGR
jgi:hypothetical protein